MARRTAKERQRNTGGPLLEFVLRIVLLVRVSHFVLRLVLRDRGCTDNRSIGQNQPLCHTNLTTGQKGQKVVAVTAWFLAKRCARSRTQEWLQCEIVMNLFLGLGVCPVTAPIANVKTSLCLLGAFNVLFLSICRFALKFIVFRH